MRASNAVLGSLLLLAILPGRAAGQPKFEVGDVAVVTRFFIATGVQFGSVQWYDANGVRKGTYAGSDQTDPDGHVVDNVLPGMAAFSPTGILHVVTQDGQIVQLAASGAVTPLYTQQSPGRDRPVSIGFAPDGTLYAGTDDFDFPGYFDVHAILRLRQDGSVEARYPRQSSVYDFKFGAENCTLHYRREGSLIRLDVCRGMDLPDTAGFDGSDMTALSDGTFLIAKDRLVQLDANGATLQTFPVQAEQFALDPTGTAVWVITNEGPGLSPFLLTKKDLATGRILAGPVSVGIHPGFAVLSIAVNGGSRVAAAITPTLQSWALVLLAITLVGCGTLCIKR